jgi:hypothetical protein
MTKMTGMAEAVTEAAVVTITMMKIMTIGVAEAVTEMQEENMMTMNVEAKKQGMDLHVVLVEDLVE